MENGQVLSPIYSYKYTALCQENSGYLPRPPFIYICARSRRFVCARMGCFLVSAQFVWMILRCVEFPCLLHVGFKAVNLKPRLHDTTCCQTRCQTGCQTALTTGCIVYTNIQPVVKPVWQPVWQTAVSCIQPVVKPVVQPGLTTGWTNSCSFNTVVKLVVKAVWQPVWQPVGCLFTRYSPLSNRLYSRFDNRLYHVNGV